MSDQITLFEKFEQLLLKNDEMLLEGIENAIPKIPQLLNDSDIKFTEYFPRKYWAQALSKRFDELFDYLVNLSKLRRIVYDTEFPKARKQEESEWNNPKYSGISDLAKQQSINLHSDAKAKAIATQLFPAGDNKITYNKLFTGPYAKYFLNLSDDKKDDIRNVIENIKNVYLTNKKGVYSGLKVGNEKEKAYWAPNYLAELARELEGTYGKGDGYDLNNPKKIAGNVAGKDSVKYATDGFVFPTASTLEKQILRHLKAIGSNVAKPLDNIDQMRLDQKEADVPFGKTDDEGVGEMEKQLTSLYEKIIANERRMNGLPKLRRNELRKQAIKRSLEYLEKYTGDNVRRQIQTLLQDQYKNKKISKELFDKLSAETKKIIIPYDQTEVVRRGGVDDRLSIRRSKEVAIPTKTTTVIPATGDKKMEEETPEQVSNPILIKSTLHKPVKLVRTNDSESVVVDTTYTDLQNPANALGEKLFDPVLFERLLRRRNARFKNTVKGRQAKAEVQKILARHGLNFNSSLQDVVEASKRYFKQKAELKDYTQGSNVSATFGLHPTRMSAQSNFLNKHHNPQKHQVVMDVFLNNGVFIRERNARPESEPTLEYIRRYVNNWLNQYSDTDRLNKLFLRRVEDILVQLGELKILENFDTPNLLIGYPFPTKQVPNPVQTFFLNSRVVDRLLRNEMIRYSRQDFFTGSRRKRGKFIDYNLIDTLEQDANDLSCKIGQRSWRHSVCLHGAELRSLNIAAERGTDIIRAVDTEKSHVLMDAKKKIRLAIEGYWDLFKVLYTLYKIDVQKTFKTPKTAANDQKIKEAAAQILTKWVESHADKDVPDFVNAFTQEYNRLITTLKPKDFELPANLRDPKGRLKPSTELAQSVSDQVSSQTGRKVFTNQANLSTDQISTLVKRYQKLVHEYPFRLEQIKNEYLESLPPVARVMFEKLNKKFNQQESAKIASVNNPSNIMRDFLHSILNETDAIESDAAYFTDNSKYLTFPNLKYLFDYFLVETFPPEDLKTTEPVNAQMKKQRIALGRVLYAELVRRNELDEFKTKTELLDSFREFLRTPRLQAFVKSYYDLIHTEQV